MHRPSAMDLPVAPLGHHWQDATHVAFGVLTAGLFTQRGKLECPCSTVASPTTPVELRSDQARFVFRAGDSESRAAVEHVRGSGYLKSPEPLDPRTSQHRLTASVLYGRPLGGGGDWSAAFLWGANAYSDTRTLAHSALLETEVTLGSAGSLFARVEVVPEARRRPRGRCAATLAPAQRTARSQRSLARIRS